MNNRKIIAITTILLSVVFNSCNNFADETIEIPRFMTLSLSGAAEGTIIHRIESGKDFTHQFHVSYGGTNNYNQGEITADIGTDFDLVDDYNSEHGTNYLPLPAGSFSFDKSSMTIQDGSHSSDFVYLTVNPASVNFAHEYLLPVTITSVKGKIPLNEESKTVYIIIYSENEDEEDPDIEEYNWEKSTWEVAGFKSQWNIVRTPDKLFDGDIASFWHSFVTNDAQGAIGEAGFPQWVTIDMMKPRPAIKGLKIRNRQNAPNTNGMPKNILFSVSNDNLAWDSPNWTDILEIAEMPAILDELDYPTTNQGITGRYLKVEIKSVYGTGSNTALAEITPY